MSWEKEWSHTHDIYMKTIHRHQGNQNINSDFPLAVPPGDIAPHSGKFPQIRLFQGGNAQIGVRQVPHRVRAHP